MCFRRRHQRIRWNESGSMRRWKSQLIVFTRLLEDFGAVTKKIQNLLCRSQNNCWRERRLKTWPSTAQLLKFNFLIFGKILSSLAARNFAKQLILFICPIMPHLAEEMWSKIGIKNLVSWKKKFPEFDAKC